MSDPLDISLSLQAIDLYNFNAALSLIRLLGIIHT